MRIDIKTLIAVLSLTACVCPGSSFQNSHSEHFGRRRVTRNEETDSDWLADERESHRRSWNRREMERMLKRESEHGEPVMCCPVDEETVQPEGGKNMDGMYVELYKNGNVRQTFHEVSCKPEFVGQPCRFMDRRMHNQSRCVQRYSYSYAIVRNVSSSSYRKDSFNLTSLSTPGSEWWLDYIQVRSGCSCEVSPLKGKKRSSGKTKKGRNRKID